VCVFSNVSVSIISLFCCDIDVILSLESAAFPALSARRTILCDSSKLLSFPLPQISAKSLIEYEQYVENAQSGSSVFSDPSRIDQPFLRTWA
jgi:hypothetical protein